MSATLISQTANFLNVTGTGTISAIGFQDTVATWSFTIPDAGGVHEFFSFSANVGTQGVPDGGSAVALLGISLVAIEFVRRKLRFRA